MIDRQKSTTVCTTTLAFLRNMLAARGYQIRRPVFFSVGVILLLLLRQRISNTLCKHKSARWWFQAVARQGLDAIDTNYCAPIAINRSLAATIRNELLVISTLDEAPDYALKGLIRSYGSDHVATAVMLPDLLPNTESQEDDVMKSLFAIRHDVGRFLYEGGAPYFHFLCLVEHSWSILSSIVAVKFNDMFRLGGILHGMVWAKLIHMQLHLSTPPSSVWQTLNEFTRGRLANDSAFSRSFIAHGIGHGLLYSVFSHRHNFSLVGFPSDVQFTLAELSTSETFCHGGETTALVMSCLDGLYDAYFRAPGVASFSMVCSIPRQYGCRTLCFQWQSYWQFDRFPLHQIPFGQESFVAAVTWQFFPAFHAESNPGSTVASKLETGFFGESLRPWRDMLLRGFGQLPSMETPTHSLDAWCRLMTDQSSTSAWYACIRAGSQAMFAVVSTDKSISDWKIPLRERHSVCRGAIESPSDLAICMNSSHHRLMDPQTCTCSP